MIAKKFQTRFLPERGKEHTMGKYFGTDGFRGEANIDLTVEHAYKVGRFLGWYFGKDHKAQIVIGKDTRRSSYMFEYSLVAGLTASGADAYLLHVTTTPSVSYVVRTENFDCGIMISASTTRSMTTESKSSTAWDRNWKPTSKRRSKPTSTTEHRRSRSQREKTSDAPWILQPEETATSDT